MELYLEDNGDYITLRGMDANGRDWVIAEITEKGIRLIASIKSSAGWPLDEIGRIKLA